MNELQKDLLRELSYDSNDRDLIIDTLKIFKRYIVDKAYQNLVEEDYLTVSKQINQAVDTIVVFSNLK